MENLLAALGIKAILGGRIEVTQAVSRKAANLEDKIRAIMHRFVIEPKFDAITDGPEFDFDKVRDSLDGDKSPEDIVARLGLSPDDALSLAPEISRVLEALRMNIPKRSTMQLTGPEFLPPSDVDVARFRRAYAVACDPIYGFNDFGAGIMTANQIEAMETMWPNIYAGSKGILADELTTAKAKDRKFRLTAGKDTVARAFLKIPRFAEGEVLSGLYLKQEEPQKGTARTSKSRDKAVNLVATPTEKVALGTR